MFFRQSKEFKFLIIRIYKRNFITIMTCIRCATKQKKCEKCVQINKQYESTKFLINFDVIIYVIKKSKREKIKMKTI